MKKMFKYFYSGLLILLFGGLHACTDFDEYSSITVGSVPAVEITAGAIADSALTVNITNSGDGYVTAGIKVSDGTTPTVDSEAFVKQNEKGYVYATKDATKGEATTFTFKGLIQNQAYMVVAVGTNADGVPSDAATLEVTTGDSHAPSLVETNPTPSLTSALGEDGVLKLIFDEPVVFDDTKAIEFWYYFQDVSFMLDADSVTVAGNTVTLKPGTLPLNREIVFVSYEEGTFTDLTGNMVAAEESGLDEEGYTFGLYYRVVQKLFEPVTILPDSASEVSFVDFQSIELTYEENVRSNSSLAGITITYKDENGDTTTKVVTSGMVTINGTQVVIDLPLPAAEGQVIELDMEEKAFLIGNSNPSAAVSIQWDVVGIL